uniref:non-specific serine/threonine protein kinase n=1 Tax=Urocitellus parryii TaxID=9999 RepID=A0A8D2HSQ7_UROPR
MKTNTTEQKRKRQTHINTDHYEFLGVIGHGGFSLIKLARHHLTGAEVAVKVVCKNEKNMPVLSEPNIMRSLDHPNIIRLFQIIETQRNIYIIMEYADGGKLLHHIPPGGMQEEKARRFFKQVVSAVDYCHDKGIVHRDLKPENVVVDARGNIKLIDFGLSTWFTSGPNRRHVWGTLSHLAPEVVLRQAHEGPHVDIWSLGVMLYFLLTGTRPFVGRTTEDLLSQIVLGTFNIPDRVPVEARQLIHQILTLNPRKRPTCKQILQHPWLTQGEVFQGPSRHCQIFQSSGLPLQTPASSGPAQDLLWPTTDPHHSSGLAQIYLTGLHGCQGQV